jgi:ribosomal protein S18 acetylase RimI-like enzyme
MVKTFGQRAAVPSDQASAREIHHAAFRETIEKQFGPWNNAQQDQFFDRAWDPRATTMLTVDEVARGYVVVVDRDDHIFLKSLAVHPQCQGVGLGTAVIRDLQDRATVRGVPLRLQVLLVNRAKNLYARLGFISRGTTQTHLLMEWTSQSV